LLWKLYVIDEPRATPTREISATVIARCATIICPGGLVVIQDVSPFVPELVAAAVGAAEIEEE
jgi:hypothetical protein